MPKKPKTPKKSVAAENRNSVESSPAAAKNEPPAPAKARKTAKSAARKTAAPRVTKVRKTAAARRRVAEPSAEQIGLRAYFISEHRQRHGAPGDHHSDWLEARRQLLIESQRN